MMISGVGGAPNSVREKVVDQGLLKELKDVIAMKAGDVLIQEGSAGDAMIIVKTGELEVTYKKQFLDVLGPGEVVGEMSLLTGRARTATVSVLKESTLYRISRGEFDRLATKDTKLFSYCMQVMAARLSRMNGIAADMMRSTETAGLDLPESAKRPAPKQEPVPQEAPPPKAPKAADNGNTEKRWD